MVTRLPVAVDAMGGDLGAGVAVAGALAAAREFGVPSVLVGIEAELADHVRALHGGPHPLVSVVHAPDVITMDESPSVAIRGKAKSSIRVAFDLVKRGEASSVVSAGNTGAVMAAGIFVSGTLPGVLRPAIASLIPKIALGKPPTVLLDSGANVDCHAHQLVQFALMGSQYAKSALGCVEPRVALLSNGSEVSKGTDIIRSAALAISELKEVRFIGYVEGRDLARDIADVVVCDGFVGNVVLKAMEGTVELVVDSMKLLVDSSLRGRLGMWLSKPLLKSLFREKLDPSSYGGAPLLGLRHVAIICHGASNERAIMNGVRVADTFCAGEVVQQLERALSSVAVTGAGTFEDGVWDRLGQRFDRRRKQKESKGGAAPRLERTDEEMGESGE